MAVWALLRFRQNHLPNFSSQIIVQISKSYAHIHYFRVLVYTLMCSSVYSGESTIPGACVIYCVNLSVWKLQNRALLDLDAE